jgi:hypothetical protein
MSPNTFMNLRQGVHRLSRTPAQRMNPDLARLIDETVGCAMRTDSLNGARGAPRGAADNPGIIGPNQ